VGDGLGEPLGRRPDGAAAEPPGSPPAPPGGQPRRREGQCRVYRETTDDMCLRVVAALEERLAIALKIAGEKTAQ
jgi:hypothetical protein